jgi:SAM-dependent methyltransferase
VLQSFLRRYARGQAAAVAPFTAGARVLDLGAGEGYVAPALAQRWGGFAVSCDVGPFRRAPGPYVVYDGARLPFRDGAFDTTLILLTLHHCSNPEGVFDEALRVTRHRLIVTESVVRTRLDRFWLHLLDGRLNARRHGGAMNVPFAFRTPAGWEALFASRGLHVVAVRWLGAWWERLVHHPELLVLERPGGPDAPHTGSVRSPQGSRGEELAVAHGDEAGGELGVGLDERHERGHLLRVGRGVVGDEQSARAEHALEIGPPARILGALGVQKDEVEGAVGRPHQHSPGVVVQL